MADWDKFRKGQCQACFDENAHRGGRGKFFSKPAMICKMCKRRLERATVMPQQKIRRIHRERQERLAVARLETQ